MKQIIQNIIKHTCYVCAGLLLVSCGDFLEITPRDIVTEDNFWDEKKDVDQMVAGCYTAMQNHNFIARCIVWGEVRGKDVDGRSDVNSFDDLYQALVNNLLPSNQFTDWSSFYHVINKCNTIIRMAPEVHEKDPAYRQSDVQATIAEMTALRSLCYWYLIRAFDAVPFYREGIQQEDEVQSLPPTSFDNVLNELIADLESVKADALEHYPATSDNDRDNGSINSNCNRITRSAINAMLCDMYLWRGNYDKVIACADEIMAVKKRDYEKNYGKTLVSFSYAPEAIAASSGNLTAYLYKNSATSPNDVFNAIFGLGNSYESLFEISFNNTGKTSPYIKSSALGEYYGSANEDKDYGVVNSGAGFLHPIADLVNEAQGTSGKWSVFRNAYDTRYFCSMQVDDGYNEGVTRKGVASTFAVAVDGGKYINYASTTTGAPFGILSYMDRNWIFYRLTDVMLMEAEAYMMKSTDDATSATNLDLWAKAFDLIEVVSNRSVTNPASQLKNTNVATHNRDQLKELLRNERRAELLFEGKTWFDMLRYCRQSGYDLGDLNNVPAKCGSRNSSKPYPSWAHVFWPYNKDEVKKNPNLNQKGIYQQGNEEDEEF